MRNFLRNVAATSTFRESSITFIGTVINGALGALFYIISARFLGPSSFGLMMVAITVLTLIGDVGDLGVNTGIVRFVGKYSSKNLDKAKKFLKLGLEVKVFVALLVISLGYILSPFLANTIFSKKELVTSLRIAFVGVSSYLLFSFIVSSLQSFQKYYSWSIIQIGTNLIRLVFVLAMLWVGILTSDNVLLIYVLIPFIGFFVGLRLIPVSFLKVKEESSVARDFFKYNKWVAIFLVAAAVGARLDTFISARLLSATEVGIYSAANQLIQIVPQIVVAISTVVAPKMAGMSSIGELVRYMKKVQVLVLGLAILGIVSIPFVVYLIPLIYGQSYLASVPVFIILLLAYLIFLISVPIHNSVFYYFSYPKLFFYLSIAHATLIGVVGWNLILSMGVMGAAITVLIGQLFNFIVPLIWVLRKIRK